METLDKEAAYSNDLLLFAILLYKELSLSVQLAHQTFHARLVVGRMSGIRNICISVWDQDARVSFQLELQTLVSREVPGGAGRHRPLRHGGGQLMSHRRKTSWRVSRGSDRSMTPTSPASSLCCASASSSATGSSPTPPVS
ncbi:hypothetical protein BDA96_01G072800 [Sorghum bicolor]|uniref:Uncharacterized protein n=2 Tax=Sorghum bicolor TaxID=4558 RepID=A0A921RX78_SORBI|nr:hypothetical protein BDA96_01G072800 [Sorghum bicolor]OQU90897.1 hypothetical protein SORBI_3001G070401 [Sorghum bicolor]